MAYEPGDVVLVPFPYRDRDATSTRPAVVVSCRAYNNQTDDLVIAGITSHPPRSSWDYELQDWSVAGLGLPSTVRMLLATVAVSRVQLAIGRLSDRDWLEVQQRIRCVFAWP
jgi:mRNA interferase MazF